MNNTALKTFLPVLGLTSTIALMGGVNPESINAAILIGNLPGDDGVGTFINPNNIKAFPFTIPSGGVNYLLDDVILPLQAYAETDVPLVQIRDNTGGSNPANSNVLATLNNPTGIGAGTFAYTFTPSSDFTFMANATYWLYVTSTNGGFSWRANTAPSIAPTGIATGGIYRFSNNGGASFNNNAIQNSLQINATEVNNPPVTTPEPGTVVSLIAFSVGLLATKKRKQDNK